jgi:hypothetical protein
MFGSAAPVQPLIAGVPAMAAEQDVPVRASPPRMEPSFESSLEPELDTATGDGGAPPDPQPGKPKPRWRKTKRTLLVVLLLLVAGVSAVGVYESRTSALEARFFAGLTEKLNYRMGKGPSDAIRFPQASPYDERLGYSNLPNYLAKLKTRD